MLDIPVRINWEGLLACIQRKGTPERVHFIELFLDAEVREAIAQSFQLCGGLSPSDPFFSEKREIRVQRFLGYDYIRQGVEGITFSFTRAAAPDTAGLPHQAGRSFMNETSGPITNWEEFETYPWPDPDRASTRVLEWLEKNLPEDMCVISGGGFTHFLEYLTWLMGYQTLCFALYEQRDLVQAIADRLMEISRRNFERILEFQRVKMIWGSDDMGFKTGTLISPADLRQFVLPGHKMIASLAHAHKMPYLLHTCGKVTAIMPDLIEDVQIDARHSFEDVIETAVQAKQRYGDRIAILGGIDVDFLCRSSEFQVRERARQTLDACFPGGGYCLGTGNSVANYIPLENYLALLDEGRKYHI